MSAHDKIDVTHLTPRVQARFHHEVTRLRLAARDASEAAAFSADLACRVIGTHLAVSIAVEQSDHYRYITNTDVKTLGGDFERILLSAKRNLAGDRQRLPGGIRFDSVSEGFFFPDGNVGDHNSSLILFTDVIRKLPVEGEPILFLPHTDMFWITGSRQSDAISLLAGMTLQEMDDRPARPITTIPYILDAETWRPWQPVSDDPAFECVRELHVRHNTLVYAAQCALLQRQFEADGRDVHVAKYQPAVDSTPSNVSQHFGVSTWTESVPTFLPRSDFVCLRRLLNREQLDNGDSSTPEFGESMIVPWESLQQVDGAPRSAEYYPERYVADQFPDAAALQSLRADAATVPQTLESLRSVPEPRRSPVGKPKSERKPRSSGTLVAMGCALGCGGSLLLAAGFVVAFFYFGQVQPRRVRQEPPLASDFPQFSPEMMEMPDMPPLQLPQEFEPGDFRLPPNASIRTVGELPPFPDLPTEPLPLLNVPEGRFIATGFAGNATENVVQDEAPEGGLLVGLRLVKGRHWGGAIRSVQPIYQVGDQYELGGVLGPEQGVEQIEYLAKPGYAVDVVRIRAGLALNAIQIEFAPRRLEPEPDESPYATKWFGSPGGSPYELTQGPFVGIDAALVEEIVGIQLIREYRQIE